MLDAAEAPVVAAFAGPLAVAVEPGTRAGDAIVAVDEEPAADPTEETLEEDELGEPEFGDEELGEPEELKRPAGPAVATADEEPFPSDLSVDLATMDSFSTGYVCQPVSLGDMELQACADLETIVSHRQ